MVDAAGLTPVQACKPLAVDPVGVALMAEEFGQVVAGAGPAL